MIAVTKNGTYIQIHWWLTLHYQETFMKIRMSLLYLRLSQFNKCLQTALHSVGSTPSWLQVRYRNVPHF